MDAVIGLLALICGMLGVLIGILATLLLRRHETHDQVMGSKRLSHRTAAGLEDALAILMDYDVYANDLHREADAITFRKQQLYNILAVLRDGPHAYDPDKPAGKRPDSIKP